MQGKSNAISILPPTVAAGETLDVEILEIALKQLWMVCLLNFLQQLNE